jgi:hypothetical protein
VVRKINQKLAPRFFGPFHVLPSHVPHFTVEKGCWCLGSYSVEAELPEGLEVDIDDLEVSYGEILNSWRWLYERERGGGSLGKAHCRILFLQFRRKYLSGLVVPDSGFHLLFIVELSLENQ